MNRQKRAGQIDRLFDFYINDVELSWWRRYICAETWQDPHTLQ